MSSQSYLPIRGRIHSSDEPIATAISLISSHRQEAPNKEASPNNLAELIERARLEGFADGVTSVNAEQVRQQTAAIENAADQLVAASQLALQARSSMIDAVIVDAVDLAINLAREIIGRELKLATNPTRDALERALRLAPDGDNFIVRVSPDSTLDVTDLLTLTHGAPITIKEDPTIQPGDCVVEIGACRIDHQVEGALSRVRLELERIAYQSEPDDEL